jgi:cellulose synthase/poly-beta-1,6-N-acetylglucosamine synthase-like glycosyltransferase
MVLSALYIGFILIFIFLAFSVFYLLVFSVAGRMVYRERFLEDQLLPGYRRIAVLVPAYKEDGIILSTATNLLHLDYPENFYDIYIIADSFQPDTILELKGLERVNVIEVSFEKSTKTKSLNEAFRRIGKDYDIALICDADNMLGKDFLSRVNQAFLQGAYAIQGQRVAKNLDTPFAILDACSEAINNTIFRKGANGLGISSSVIGSGMAFDYITVRDILSNIDAVGGFDKILQLKVVENGEIIHFLESALVFDEKVDSPEAFQQQRRRWVSSQFIYLKRFVGPGLRQLLRGNISYFNLALVSNLILPRAFLLALLPLVAVAGYFIGVAWGISATLLWLLYLASLFLALPRVMVNKDLNRALAKLPGAVLVMITTLFHLKKANKTFIHTVHTKTEISNSLFNDKSKQ